MKIVPVWSTNFFQEIASFDAALHCHRVLSIDTEFPGFLRNTPRHAPACVRYDDLKFNVDSTKIIQLGITLSDNEGNIGGTWEFNFSDFDVQKDAYADESILLLKNNGLDLDKIQKDGIPKNVFVPRFMQILSKHNHLKWVTFHGLYDFAYLVKLFTNRPLPPTDKAFAGCAAWYFQTVFDIKIVAKYCKGLRGGEIGLSKVGEILKIERIGEAHNAGSDSLLTALIFGKMKECYGIEEGAFQGFLYGMQARVVRGPPKIIVPRYCQPLIIRHPTFVRFVPIHNPTVFITRIPMMM